jgi:hypothetical protein
MKIYMAGPLFSTAEQGNSAGEGMRFSCRRSTSSGKT